MKRIAGQFKQSKWLEWRTIRLLIAAILLFSAFLKWRDFGTSNALFDIAPSLEFGLIQLEVLIGVWLLLGWSENAARYCTLLLFAAFSGALFAMVLQRKPSCGCLGSVEFNPIWFFLMDISIVTLLVWVRPAEVGQIRDGAIEKISRLSNSQILASLFATTMGFAGVFFNVEVGSWYARNLPVALTGQVLVTDPMMAKASPGGSGDWRTLKFNVLNRGNELVRIIGAEQNCKCRAINSLPVEIPAGEMASIVVDVKRGSKSAFSLLTSSSRQPRLVCRWVVE